MPASIPASGVISPETEILDTTIAALGTAAIAAADDMQYEPVVRKWPRKVRLAFIAAVTAGLWFAGARLWG